MIKEMPIPCFVPSPAEKRGANKKKDELKGKKKNTHKLPLDYFHPTLPPTSMSKHPSTHKSQPLLSRALSLYMRYCKAKATRTPIAAKLTLEEANFSAPLLPVDPLEPPPFAV